MEIVERILSKVVGNDLSAAETELVGGAQIDHCVQSGGYWTGIVDSTAIHCDFD